ncbi:toll/interleukin-1 receptor domain-containing protein [Amycolatopsis rubida]|uniref:Toll/interleukin-1 receptor domain-containing protein n=1 Tax=Amycolatopsis rubida TaxID=112413 RepID=A0ABX0C8X7_9PSEU|nr:toll/interleukin-1 receptor domain-containing protein [Amycolatopsis sp. M39]MYW96418.1 TIR domain-containing protein [Amycolatopsis rubida]NEC61405.1 toll/interleukin-1 receptor domain-containing protein [Amycolatopsis rubida]
MSFAGEDREFVEAVVREVAEAGYQVFSDQDEQVALWGEDLTEYLPKIYEERARYAVMFVSRHYAAKPWTRFERAGAGDRSAGTVFASGALGRDPARRGPGQHQLPGRKPRRDERRRERDLHETGSAAAAGSPATFRATSTKPRC